MAYVIDILRAPEKFLDKLSRQQPSDAAAIEDAIDGLAEEPRPVGATPLRGFPGVLRLRVGNYRLCYHVDDDRLVVLIITISTRDDVYQVLRRALGR